MVDPHRGLRAWLIASIAAVFLTLMVGGVTRLTESGLSITVEHMHSGDAFLTERGPFVDAVVAAVERTTGLIPTLSTTGGTSDARFIRAMCPVLELGLVGQTMHQIDERAPVAEIEQLARVYERVIDLYFQRFA